MKPVYFKEHNVIFAKNQKEYIPLPAFKQINSPKGEVVFCHSFSLMERIKILFVGKLWSTVMTFNKDLQPLFMSTLKKDHLVTIEDLADEKTMKVNK